MTEFAFDPYAALVRIKERAPTPATVATPATEHPPPVETVAAVAGIAGGGVRNAESDGPVAASADCPVTDLFERIGLMDEAGGQEGYDAAARDLGYASFDAAIRAIVNGWATHLRDCAHPAIEDARANWRWCEIAVRHGWCTQSLWGRQSGLYPRLRGQKIRNLYRDYIVTSSGAILMRCPRDGDPPIWARSDDDSAEELTQ